VSAPVTDYTNLSLAEVRRGLDDAARDAHATFGRLDRAQLNWRPDATRWSVAQCLEHLIKANALMLVAAADALDGSKPRTIWQRLPITPGVFGRMLIRSQAPTATRKYTADPQAHPATSDIGADILQRFVAQHRDLNARLQSLDERTAARAIMTSPFIKVISYSVLDGWRLMLAHDHRHIQQARRVMDAPGFPRA